MGLEKINIRNYLLFAIAFALPVFPNALPLLIVLLGIEWLFYCIRQGSASLSVFRRSEMLIFVSVFLFYLVGLLFSENLEYGFADMQTKLSLLVFPLIFATPGYFTGIKVRNVHYAFVFGNVAAVLLCLGKAFHYFVFVKHDIYIFYGTGLSSIIHPSYFAMYLNLSILFLLLEFYSKGINTRLARVSVFIIVLLSMTIFFLSSKMGVITFILSVFLFLLIQMLTRKTYIREAIAIIVLFFMTYLLFHFSSFLSGRFEKTVSVITNTGSQPESESSALRAMTWKSALEIIMENPLAGVGTGDIKDALMEKYSSKGMSYAYKLRLNVHNQFLQTACSLGLIGLLLLLLSFFVSFFSSVREKKLLFFFFLMLTFLNFLVESMLETQAGVIFFSFFLSFFMFSRRIEEEY